MPQLVYIFVIICWETLIYFICQRHTWHCAVYILKLYFMLLGKKSMSTDTYGKTEAAAEHQSLHHECRYIMCFHLARGEFKAMGWSEIKIKSSERMLSFWKMFEKISSGLKNSSWSPKLMQMCKVDRDWQHAKFSKLLFKTTTATT